MKLLVCGTRGTKCRLEVERALNKALDTGKLEVVSGACKDSADEYAAEWAKKHGVSIEEFPGGQGTYLKRNKEMVDKADCVLAFWDGWSYGTAHTIASAVEKNIPVQVIKVRKFYRGQK